MENWAESLTVLSGATSANTKTTSPLWFFNLLGPGLSSTMAGPGKRQWTAQSELYALCSWKEGWTVLTFVMKAKQLHSEDFYLPFYFMGILQ